MRIKARGTKLRYDLSTRHGMEQTSLKMFVGLKTVGARKRRDTKAKNGTSLRNWRSSLSAGVCTPCGAIARCRRRIGHVERVSYHSPPQYGVLQASLCQQNVRQRAQGWVTSSHIAVASKDRKTPHISRKLKSPVLRRFRCRAENSSDSSDTQRAVSAFARVLFVTFNLYQSQCFTREVIQRVRLQRYLYGLFTLVSVAEST